MAGTVRKATIDDAEAIGRVHYAAHVETYTGKFPEGVIESFPPEQRARSWERILSESPGEVWVAEVGGDGSPLEVVGFASAVAARDDDPPRELELAAIYLLAAHHASGLGQMLLDAAIGDRPASLWVLDDNPRAREFYRRNGFAPDGAEKLDERWGSIREIRMVR
jgi:ribosomal protein S18 acetylase RimI-like enzyme